MKKITAIFLLSSFFFTFSSLVSLAADFSPTYSGIFSDSNASVSPDVTLAVYQDPGEELFRSVVFSFPPGFDVKGSADIADGTVIGTGSFQALAGGSSINFPVTVRSYAQAGSKAHWVYTINSLNVDAYLNGSKTSGHTLSLTTPLVPISPQLSFVVNYSAGLFVNPSAGGPFTFSAHFISTTGLNADSSWSGSIAAPPGPSYTTPYTTPKPTYPTPYPTPPTPVPVEENKPTSPQQPGVVKKNAPKITLNQILSPTKQNQVSLNGKVTFETTIEKVEVSVDGGKNWFIAKLANVSGNSLDYQFQTPPLDDDNYSVVARATDVAKIVGLSDKQTLVVDTAPPIVGGNELLLGGTPIFPDSSGSISAVEGVSQSLILSAKGGPQQIKIDSEGKSFSLNRIENSNLWQGNLQFDKEGDYPLTIEAKDGAGNNTKRSINKINVLPSGLTVDKESGKPVEAKVQLFSKDFDGAWLAWDGESYSQTNPIQTKKDGRYSYFVPEGSYYLKVESQGYRDFVSQEFSIEKPAQINFKIPLTHRPSVNLLGISITLPFWLDLGARIEKIKLENPASISIGKKYLPTLSSAKLADLTGAEKTLTSYKGSPVVFTFWSTWNGSSAEQLTEIAKVKNLKVVVIASQDSQGVVTSYLTRAGVSLEVLVDKNGEVGSELGITTLPEHFFVDKEGKVVNSRIGVLNAKSLMEIAKSLD